MTTIISGSAQNITFSDSTTQTTAALPLTGGQLSGNMTFATGTNGIVFNNSSALTNSTLNDYETGTFTPVFQNVGSATYTNQTGFYTKVGNVVTVNIGISTSAQAQNSNAIQINLPFATTSTSLFRCAGALGYTKGLTFTGIPVASTSGSSSSFYFYSCPSNSTPSPINYNGLLSACELQITMTYIANF